MGDFENLYELATCGDDTELWKWIDAPKEQFEMLHNMPGSRKCSLEEWRMHMLFVHWATQ